MAGPVGRPPKMSRFTPLPSERIAEWHATVSDSALRALDEQLLLDLLVIEEVDARRRQVATIVSDYLRTADRETAAKFELRCRDLGVAPSPAAAAPLEHSPRRVDAGRAHDSEQVPPLQPPGGIKDSSGEMRERYLSAVGAAETAWDAAAADGAIDLDAAERAIDDLADAVTRDRRLIVALTETEESGHYTFTHMVNVAILMLDQARALGIDGQLLRDMGLGALLHDIGKVLTPKEILDKPVRLTPAEFEIMQRHTVDGATILRRTPGMPALAPVVAFEHHLRLDGSGYPAAARRERLNLGTMMCSIADVYDAMRSQRTYQPAYPADRILAVLRSGRKPQFDPDLVQRFFELLDIRLPGGLASL